MTYRTYNALEDELRFILDKHEVPADDQLVNDLSRLIRTGQGVHRDICTNCWDCDKPCYCHPRFDE